MQQIFIHYILVTFQFFGQFFERMIDNLKFVTTLQHYFMIRKSHLAQIASMWGK